MALSKPIAAVAGVQRIAQSSGLNELLENISISVSEKELKHLSQTGAFITVSNRPVGAVEELILMKLLADVRNDFRFLTNEFLEESNIASQSFFFQNLEDEISQLNEKNRCISLFPVGNISKFQTPQLSFTDSKWDKLVLKLIYESNLAVVPVYISVLDDGINKLLGMLHPALKVRRLVSHLIEKKKVEVKVRIGKPLHPQKIGLKNADQFGRFLRAKLYSIGSALEVEKFYQPKNEQQIIDEVKPEIIRAELKEIEVENLIAEQGDFQLFLAKAKKIPNTLNEIGRLREITFRSVGEGTSKAVDLDEFDLHYLHLFLWDKKHERIAGAYRIGAGDYIMKSIGKKGFYLRSLFKIGNEMNEVLAQSLELGRSFVTETYQRHRLPLFMLWKGIAYFIRNNPQLKYIIGPVSISSSYSKLSRSLIVAYIKKYKWNEEFAAFVKPKKSFKPDLKGLDVESILELTQDDEKKFDNIIEDMEPTNLKMPVLLKKYFKQNGQIIAFNVDPAFNDALDGFMISEISKLPADALETF